MREAIQTWCVRCQWPGRQPFLVGTFTTVFGTPDQEAKEQALLHWQESMGEILPENIALPDFIELIPGAIIMVPRD